jgi:hypothetical protein
VTTAARTDRSSELERWRHVRECPFPDMPRIENAHQNSSARVGPGEFSGRVPRRERERAPGSPVRAGVGLRTVSATSRRRCASGRRRLHWRGSERASCAAAALAWTRHGSPPCLAVACAVPMHGVITGAGADSHVAARFAWLRHSLQYLRSVSAQNGQGWSSQLPFARTVARLQGRRQRRSSGAGALYAPAALSEGST